MQLLLGISKEKGVEHFMIFPKSVNTARFKSFLEEVRAKNVGEKICLFMDNLSVHISEKAKKKMRELDFRYIYCVKYSP